MKMPRQAANLTGAIDWKQMYDRKSGRWCQVSKGEPCPACGRSSWCAWTPDRELLKCERTADPPSGMRFVKAADGGALFAPADHRPGPNGNGDRLKRPESARPQNAPAHWAQLTERFEAAATEDHRVSLATILGVNIGSLASIGIGWASRDELRAMRAGGAGWSENFPNGAFTFPERDGKGRVVGLALRATDGRKGAPAGAMRGLIVPATLNDSPGPILVVEGASDVAALSSIGLTAVGRPSNSGGAEYLAELLDGRDALIVGENDAKPGGAWPGRDGAKSVALRLAVAWGEAVEWTLLPAGFKDVRAWLNAKVDGGLRLDDPAVRKAAADELLDALRENAREVQPERLSQADALVNLANELFRVGLSESNEPFVVPRDGPNIAIMFRGGADTLRATLAREFRRATGKTPNGGALTDALVALHGAATDAEPEPVHLRLAEHDDGIVIDMADRTGRAVVVRPGGWEVVTRSPVLFRRTALTSAMPEPERGGDLNALRRLLNVTSESWPLVVGWMLAAFTPGIPRPVLMFGGQQGSGKTTAARIIVSLSDPSPAPTRSQPRDDRDWAVAASSSMTFAIDNVSNIANWWSDALCRAVSGDGWIVRALFTDSSLSVLSFRRSVILTSIDPGALRGDLGDRLLLVDLEPIAESERRTECELNTAFESVRAGVWGGLLDLFSRVLDRLPGVELAQLPRMADFSRVLAAMDSELGTTALQSFIAQRGRIADDVLEGDPVGSAIRAAVAAGGRLEGAAAELLARLRPEHPGPDWPKNPRAMAARIKRVAPALASAGISVRAPTHADRPRRYGFWTDGTDGSTENALGDTENADSAPTVAASVGVDRRTDRREKNGLGAGENAVSRRSDGSDGSLRGISGCIDGGRRELSNTEALARSGRDTRGFPNPTDYGGMTFTERASHWRHERGQTP